MPASKISIKSKKEKLWEKKHNKSTDDRANGKVINLDEDSNQAHEPFQAKRFNPPEKVRHMHMWNKFNPNILRKYQPPEHPQNENSSEQLSYVDEAHGGTSEEDRRTIHSYKIEGQDKLRHISMSHLAEKVEKAAINKDKTTNEDVIEISDDDKKEPQRPLKLRYFHDLEEEHKESVIKCYRCQGKGHIAKNCPEELKLSCMLCLGPHHFTECDSRTCFRCNQVGHIAQDCTSSGSSCKRCNRKGHSHKNCGVLLGVDYHLTSHQEIKAKYDDSDLKRLQCMADCKDSKGHFNCVDYRNWHGSNPYDNRS